MCQITITQALQQSCQTIDRNDARILLQHVLKANYAFMLAHPEQVLTLGQVAALDGLVTRRENGEPIAYLIGEQGFYDLIFKVTPAVLIPRPETELLVELGLARIPTDCTCRILDLGTGSGAIAVTLAKHRPQSNVVAVDLSMDAVLVARMNADAHSVSNLSIVTSDWFDQLGGDEFDVIVANPPYVAEDDPHLSQGDLRFEPQMALSAADEGLACLQHIVATAPEYLKTDGWLLLEHGYDQADACRGLLQAAGFSQLFSHPDLAGILRVSGGRL